MPAAGVPLSVPVPLPLSTNVTPAGSATPPIASVGSGRPLVVTVNDPGMTNREGRARRARDGRPFVDVQREGLRAIRQHAVRRGERERRSVPPVPAAGVPLNVPRAVAVVHERHARGQRPADRDAPGPARRWPSP